jgi:hypothetical protein
LRIGCGALGDTDAEGLGGFCRVGLVLGRGEWAGGGERLIN